MRSEFVPTGQTGIAIAGWGISVDAVVADFIAGAAEQLVLEGVERGGELLWVEGQGSLLHPAYSGVTLGLLHGSAPHALVLCHKPGSATSTATSATRSRRSPSSSSSTSALALSRGPPGCVAIALNTRDLDDEAARAAIGGRHRRDGTSGVRPCTIWPIPAHRRGAPGNLTFPPNKARQEAYRGAGNRCRRSSPASASANLIVGINDDVKYEASESAFFMPTMAAEGLKMNALTIRWDETQPTAIDPDLQDYLAQVIDAAATAGVTVELDLYPLHSQALTGGRRCPVSPDPTACGDSTRIAQFAAWTAMVAQTFPTVHQFIVMNECNQPLFVNPQWNAVGTNQSAAVCGHALAASYDALKAVSTSNFVWGVGLSPRGNDSPNAPSDSSTSPVKFLGALGAWFRSSRRRRTGRAAHGRPRLPPLPGAAVALVRQGLRHPRDASITNLPRIYQAFYDGFNGTPQRTIGQQKGGGLPLSLNEMGIQTDTSKQPGYGGLEVSANSAGGMVGQFASEAYQANHYKQILQLLSCDPNVRVINIFHLVDEPDLAGWRSRLYWVGAGTPVAKQTATMLTSWMAQTRGACQGKLVPWTPTRVPLSAK